MDTVIAKLAAERDAARTKRDESKGRGPHGPHPADQHPLGATMDEIKAGDKLYAVYDGYGSAPSVEVAVIVKVTPQRYYINREDWETNGYTYAGLAFKCARVLDRNDARYLSRTPKAAWETYITNLKAKREQLAEQARRVSDSIQKATEAMEAL